MLVIPKQRRTSAASGARKESSPPEEGAPRTSSPDENADAGNAGTSPAVKGPPPKRARSAAAPVKSFDGAKNFIAQLQASDADPKPKARANTSSRKAPGSGDASQNRGGPAGVPIAWTNSRRTPCTRSATFSLRTRRQLRAGWVGRRDRADRARRARPKARRSTSSWPSLAGQRPGEPPRAARRGRRAGRQAAERERQRHPGNHDAACERASAARRTVSLAQGCGPPPAPQVLYEGALGTSSFPSSTNPRRRQPTATASTTPSRTGSETPSHPVRPLGVPPRRWCAAWSESRPAAGGDPPRTCRDSGKGLQAKNANYAVSAAASVSTRSPTPNSEFSTARPGRWTDGRGACL